MPLGAPLPRGLLAANCALPVAVYEAAVRLGCRGFVFVSTAKVLGEVSRAEAIRATARWFAKAPAERT